MGKESGFFWRRLLHFFFLFLEQIPSLPGPPLAHLLKKKIELLPQGWKDDFSSSPFPLSRRGALSPICSCFWVSDLRVRILHLENALPATELSQKRALIWGSEGQTRVPVQTFIVLGPWPRHLTSSNLSVAVLSSAKYPVLLSLISHLR